MIFGIPYMGSKTKTAPDIIRQLPAGERFVDLFGGGFAMSQAAAVSGKYKKVLYNDINPLLPPLIQKAIRGGYNYNCFKPVFIEPEEFKKLRLTDGYVQCCWSFGSNGQDYLFGKDIIDLKREAHNFIVFGVPTKHFRTIERFVTSKDIRIRKSQFQQTVKRMMKTDGDLRTLERLHRLQNLQTLERLHRLQNLQTLERLQHLFEYKTSSYGDYSFREGDVVYCDPPYEDTHEYDVEFNHEAFYSWIKSRPYQVWFSSYQGIKGFRMVWAKRLITTYGTNNNCEHFECLYTNR